MGSCLSKCYTGGGGGLVVDADPDAVKEKHVVICQSSHRRPEREAVAIATSFASSPFSSAVSFSSPPNPSASPSSSSFSFSSMSANCSSCPPTPARSPPKERSVSKKAPRASLLDAERHIPARRVPKQAGRARSCSCSPAARVGRHGSTAAAAPGGRRTVRSAPKVRRSRSSVGGFGEMEAVRKRINPAARPARRRKESCVVQSIKQGQLGRQGTEAFSTCQSSVAPLVEDLNNPLISMDCFIFL